MSLGMAKAPIPKPIPVILICLGILVTEAQLYLVYSSDASFMMNITFVVGVVIAGCAAVALTLLLTGHEVGGGVGALVIGAVLVVILLRSGDSRYFVPPFLEVAGGLLVVIGQGRAPAIVARPGTQRQ